MKLCINLRRNVILDDFGWIFGEVLDVYKFGQFLVSLLCVVNLEYSLDIVINELFLG